MADYLLKNWKHNYKEPCTAAKLFYKSIFFSIFSAADDNIIADYIHHFRYFIKTDCFSCKFICYVLGCCRFVRVSAVHFINYIF